MNLFYCMGGGWGHLRRTRVFIDLLNISPVKVITASPLAERLFSSEELVMIDPNLSGDRKQYNQRLSEIISAENPVAFYIDTFPCGILGELKSVVFSPETNLYLVTRRVKWDNYRALACTMPFEKVFLLEEPEPGQLEYLRLCSQEVVTMELDYPVPERAEPVNFKRPMWLVVHGFVEEEVLSLVHYARDEAKLQEQWPEIVVISDCEIREEGVEWRNEYPASAWFPHAARIFTAAGFNTIQETRPYRHKQKIIPFPRKYDDQFWRSRE
ncbi:MAG: hypothetical protein OEX02_17995 [Cyclobacteriaceae bacterium]|nr:hypothetical protein [Cyclobacteriaceae bacterium]